MAIFGIGSASKYNIYIIVATFSKLFSDILIGLNPLNSDKPAALLGFIPKLNDHLLLQNAMEFLGFIIGGIIIFFLIERNDEKAERNISLTINYTQNSFLERSIQNSFSLSPKNKKEIYMGLFLVALFFSLNLIIRSFIYLNFLDIELWMVEILFISFLSKKILKIQLNRHKIVAMFIIVPLLILELISNLLPETNHPNVQNNIEYMSDYNIYKIIGIKIGYYYIPLLYICLFSATMMRDYSWVKSKYLMDKKSISLFKVCFFSGLIGLFITIIFFILSSFIPCKTFNNVIKDENNNFLISNNFINLSREICYLQEYDDNKKTLKLYYDNFFILINDFKTFDKEVKKELFIVLPLYLITNMIKISCHMIMIKYLEGYNILISDNLYYFINRLIVFIINKANEEYLTIIQFIIMQFLEIIYITVNLIYIEIIELKFCNLDYDLKKNIEKRSLIDYGKEMESEEGKSIESNKCKDYVDVGDGYVVKPEDFKLDKIIE